MRGFPAFGALIMLAGAAQASTSYFTASGMVASEPANAAAAFTISGNTLTIELWNTGGAGKVQDISSELTGITFDLTGGTAVVVNDASLTGSAPDGAVDCSSTNPCSSATVPASPLNWAISGTGTLCLEAGGCGTGHDYAIVNSNVVPDDGVSSGPHNPLLLSSTTDAGIGVTFTVTFTDTIAPTGVGDVVFGFGTAGGTVDGVTSSAPTPEPISVLLTGSGLLGLVLRKRLFKR